MSQIEVLKQALDALEIGWSPKYFDFADAREKGMKAITSLRQAIAETNKQVTGEWKLVPRNPTREMLEAMDECSMEGYDERLYAGMAASVFMAAVDAAPCQPKPRTGNCLLTGVCAAEGHKIQKAEKQEPVDKKGSPCPEFWEWLPKAYNFNGDGNFTKYNMEVAFLAGKQSVASNDTSQKCVDKNQNHRHDTSPPQRQPLTDEQIAKCYETTGHYQTLRPQDRFAVFALARAIEAAHGIKGEA